MRIIFHWKPGFFLRGCLLKIIFQRNLVFVDFTSIKQMPCSICSENANLTICQTCSLMLCERCIQDYHECERTQSMATNSNPNSTNHSASTSSSSSSNQTTPNGEKRFAVSLKISFYHAVTVLIK